MNRIVFYHKNCIDGLFAAYAAWLRYDHMDEETSGTTLYIPVSYNEIQGKSPAVALSDLLNKHDPEKKLSVLKQCDVYVLDFSFPVDHFKYHCEVFGVVTVLDHHASAERDYAKEFPVVEGTLYNVYRNSTNSQYGSALNVYRNPTISEYGSALFAKEMSGALFAYKMLVGYNDTGLSHLKSEEGIPMPFHLVSDRDLWIFKYGDLTREFNAGIKALDYQSFEDLHYDLICGMDKIIKTGKAYMKERQRRVELAAKDVSTVTVSCIDVANPNTVQAQFEVAVVNTHLEIASELGDHILKNRDTLHAIKYVPQAVIMFSIDKDSVVRCSIRSTELVDCSAIAKQFGGGGHKQASGFSMSLDQLYHMLKNKHLELTFNEDSPKPFRTVMGY